MKKILSIVAILALFVGVGCTENFGEDKKGDTTFTLEQLEVNATAEGGAVEVNYSIENPQSGAVVLTECNDGWIKNLNTATYGIIKFNVEPNYKNEARQTTINVAYTGTKEKFEIKVMQEASNVEAFSYSIITQKSTALAIEVTPANTNAAYICRTYTKEHMDVFGLTNSESIIYYDLDAIQNEAKAASQTLLNYLQNICYKGQAIVDFTSLVPDTEYVVYCYHIDLSNGQATDWEVYSEVIRTASTQTIDENITMSFDINGAHISQTITTENPETYYFTECWAVDDFYAYFGSNATPKEIFPRRWNEQITMRLNMGYQPYNIISDLCKQGTQTIEYNELKAETEYIFYVFAVNPETAYTASEIVVENVTTSNATDTGVTIDIEVKNIFYTTADIYFTASDPNATFRRTVLTKAQYQACGSTDTARFVAFEANGYVNSYTATGSTDINYTKGEPGVTFVAIAFGVDGETPNTRIFTKEFTFMSDVAGTSNINFSYTKHYNLAEVAVVDAEHWGNYAEYDNYALVPMTISGVADGDTVYYMVDTRVIDMQKESQWLAEVAQERHVKNHYHNCYFTLEYDKEYTIVAVAKDKNGNFGTLYLTEMIVYKSDSADVASYNYVEVR
ncbi:MAG: BACON domain-containing protein [Alistipes sp.]|nr:BACON domain-containing protein [Alistipes sp.]